MPIKRPQLVNNEFYHIVKFLASTRTVLVETSLKEVLKHGSSYKLKRKIENTINAQRVD